MKKMGAMNDRIGIMLKHDRATIGRRMLSGIIYYGSEATSTTSACCRGPEEATRKIMKKETPTSRP
jgi:hypothetical protein